MQGKSAKKTRKCRQCKGHPCIHEKTTEEKEEPNEKQPVSTATRSLEMLEKLLIEKEGHPDEIVKLSEKEELFKLLGMDPLCVVAAAGHFDLTRRFVEAGTNPNGRQSADGNTPLMLATQNKHVEVVEILLKHGADLIAVNNDGNNAFMLSVKTGDAKVVNIMCRYKGNLDINYQNNLGYSVLHIACDISWGGCVEFLLKLEVDVNLQCKNGRTALMLAVIKGEKRIVQKLLDTGADLLREDKAGRTALEHVPASEVNLILSLLDHLQEHNLVEAFLKNRLDKLKSPMSDDAFLQLVSPVFDVIAKMTDLGSHRDVLFKQKLIPTTMTIVQKHLKMKEANIGAAVIFTSCMINQESQNVEERFAQQFTKANGFDFCLKALKLLFDNIKKDFDTMIECFFPIICACNTSTGKAWFEKNSSKIIPYTCIRDHFTACTHAFKIRKKLWEEFWETFRILQEEQRDKKMAELLEEEERERNKKLKKRERKKLRRHRINDLKTGDFQSVVSNAGSGDSESKTDILKSSDDFPILSENDKDANQESLQKERNEHLKYENITENAKTPKSRRSTKSKNFLAEFEAANNFQDPEFDDSDCPWTTVQPKKQSPKSDAKPVNRSPDKRNERDAFPPFPKSGVPKNSKCWADVAKVKKHSQAMETKLEEHHWSAENPNPGNNKRKSENYEDDFPSLHQQSPPKSSVNSDGQSAAIDYWCPDDWLEISTGSTPNDLDKELDALPISHENIHEDQDDTFSLNEEPCRNPDAQINTESIDWVNELVEESSANEENQTLQAAVTCPDLFEDRSPDLQFWSNQTENMINASKQQTATAYAGQVEGYKIPESLFLYEGQTQVNISVDNGPVSTPVSPPPVDNRFGTKNVEPRSPISVMSSNHEAIQMAPIQLPTSNDCRFNGSMYSNIRTTTAGQSYTPSSHYNGNTNKDWFLANNIDRYLREKPHITSKTPYSQKDLSSFSNPTSNIFGLRTSPQQATISETNDQTVNHERTKTSVAVIKPLMNADQQNKDNAHPENERQDRNCELGESILQNVARLRLEEEGDAWFPSSLRGNTEVEETNNTFPSLYDDTENLVADWESSSQTVRKLSIHQLQQHYNALKKSGKAFNSPQYHDIPYFASCLGITEHDLERSFVSDLKTNTVESRNFSVPSTDPFRTLLKDSEGRSGSRESNDLWEKSSGEMNVRPSMQEKVESPLSNVSFVHQINHLSSRSPPFHSPRTPSFGNLETLPSQSFIPPRAPRSLRWRQQLAEIRNLPASSMKQIGNIMIPTSNDRYLVPYSDTNAILGFLVDGSEVLVHMIDISCRPINTDVLQSVISPRSSQTFLVRYRTFAFDNGRCYIAMDLPEYSLSEYLAVLKSDTRADPLIVNKLAWQFLKGLSSLHDTLGWQHGNMMPSNIFIDVEGKLLLSEYSFVKPDFTKGKFLGLKSIEHDRGCWTPTEVITETEAYSMKSDIQVAGMILHYILSGGHHPYGEMSLEIQVSLQQNWPKTTYISEEVNGLINEMLVMPPSSRPSMDQILKHPYFWANEKRLRFVLIAGSDVLRDMKSGTSTTGGTGGTMIDIINAVGKNFSISEWMSSVDHIILKEMKSFRQYKNTLVELVLFVYNCCLHFDKLSQAARDRIDEPCKYFLTTFPSLFMSVYTAIKSSARVERVCYKPFF